MYDTDKSNKVAFPEAVKRLNGKALKAPKNTTRKKDAPGLSVKDRKLLARVVGYYQHTLSKDSRGLNYLKQDRGIADNQTLKG